MGKFQPSKGAEEVGATEDKAIVISAPGVYDPEKQLSSAEIQLLKEKLQDHGVKARVCTHIVLSMVLEGYEVIEEKDAAQQRETDIAGYPLIGENGEYRDEVEFAKCVGTLSCYWTSVLQDAVSLPGSEWPRDITPPSRFAEALKEVETSDQMSRT